MRKTNFWKRSLLTLLTLFCGLLSSFPVLQADNVQLPTMVVLHHGKLNSAGETDGINTEFSVYDLSQPFENVGQSQAEQESFFESLGRKKPSEINNYIKNSSLPKIIALKTDNTGTTPAFKVESSIKAILIVQNGKSTNSKGQEVIAQPLALSFPVTDENGDIENNLDVYTKSLLVPVPPTEPTQPSTPNNPTPTEPEPVQPVEPGGCPSQPKNPGHGGYQTPPQATETNKPGRTNKVSPLLPKTGVVKRNAFWLGLILIVISTVTIIILKRKKGEVLDEEKQ